ncbi:hypothetical protein BaRGS_00025472 [Batillaria attramentaria]|uniref:Uncharacterized protein n=1 Tax=Batillaria attramentaria TaxID=370345 RepID=A0ABD0K8B1_9CAEN
MDTNTNISKSPNVLGERKFYYAVLQKAGILGPRWLSTSWAVSGERRGGPQACCPAPPAIHCDVKDSATWRHFWQPPHERGNHPNNNLLPTLGVNCFGWGKLAKKEGGGGREAAGHPSVCV